MKPELKGKVALITGASRGIGRSTAIKLAENQMKLALVARNEKGLQETQKLCEEAGGEAKIFPFDLSKTDNIHQLVEDVYKKFHSLSVLINNAGIYTRGKSDSCNLEEWDQVIDINLRSIIHLNRHALPHVEKNDWGAIINISSIAGKMSHRGAGIYCTSKHGLMGYSGCLFEDVRDKNIKVTAICPGYVNTDMPSGKLDFNKMIQPDDIAETILYILQLPLTACPTEIIIRPQNDCTL